MSQENVDKARATVEAYNRRQFDAAIRDFAPDIEWAFTPRLPDWETLHGPAEIVDFWGMLDETFGGFTLELGRFRAAGDCVMTPVRFTAVGQGSGALTALNAFMVFRFRAGSISRIDYYLDRSQALAATGLRE